MSRSMSRTLEVLTPENEQDEFSERSEKVEVEVIKSSEESFAQAFIRNMNEDLNDIKRSFIKIGFRLTEADEFEYYKELGYKSIVELAEAEFGFKQSTTYEFMKVYKLAHDPDCRWHIAAEYDKYSYSQLLALTYAKHVGTAFWRIVKPTDSVRKLKQFVSNWNEEYRTGCGYHPELKTVDEYLAAYEAKQAKKQISAYAGQLPGQISFDEEPEQEEFSERSENSEPQNNVQEVVTAPMTDDELMEYCLKYDVRNYAHKDLKLLIQRAYVQEPGMAAFKKFVELNYGSFFVDKGEAHFLSDTQGLTIYRPSGGKIILAWGSVAGKISRLICANNYLTAEERSRYLQTEYFEIKNSVALPEQPESEAEFSERSEKSEFLQKHCRTNREYLSTLPDEEFVSELCLKILGIFPMNGKSAQFMSAVKGKLAAWLKEPRG